MVLLLVNLLVELLLVVLTLELEAFFVEDGAFTVVVGSPIVTPGNVPLRVISVPMVKPGGSVKPDGRVTPGGRVKGFPSCPVVSLRVVRLPTVVLPGLTNTCGRQFAWEFSRATAIRSCWVFIVVWLFVDFGKVVCVTLGSAQQLPRMQYIFHPIFGSLEPHTRALQNSQLWIQGNIRTSY